MGLISANLLSSLNDGECNGVANANMSYMHFTSHLS